MKVFDLAKLTTQSDSTALLYPEIQALPQRILRISNEQIEGPLKNIEKLFPRLLEEFTH